MKKLIVAAVALLAMVGTSFAAQTASINVTSEPIVQGATCGKAGGITLSFDDATVLTIGDKITFDLDLDTVLCKSINLYIAANGGVDTPGLIAGVLTGPTGAIATSDALDTLTFDANGGANAGIYFLLTGTKGTARVTLSVMGDANNTDGAFLTFAAVTDPTDTLIFSFLDGDDDFVGDDIAIYEVDTTVAFDGTDATVEDNSLCIDVSQTAAATIDANFDSADDIYTFSPSDPQVAHVVAGSTYSLYEHKSRVEGNILFPEAAAQTACAAINNEGTGNAAGYCETGEEHAYNDVILKSDSAFSLDGEVQVTLEILVNGNSGNNGVYWAGTGIQTDADVTADTLAPAGPGIATTAYLADGLTIATQDVDEADCVVAAADKGVILKGTATSASLGMDALNKFIQFDLPLMHFDTTEASEGDIVSVKITVETLPCGFILEEAWEVGTFGCVTGSTAYGRTYPYFAKGTGSYANAIIITNVGTADGTASLTLREEDGDVFTASIDVVAGGMYVNLLDSISWTAAAGTTGTAGDARSWVAVSANFAIDGAAMITNATTGESIGYLPR